jgi:hypothetical protein
MLAEVLLSSCSEDRVEMAAADAEMLTEVFVPPVAEDPEAAGMADLSTDAGGFRDVPLVDGKLSACAGKGCVGNEEGESASDAAAAAAATAAAEEEDPLEEPEVDVLLDIGVADGVEVCVITALLLPAAICCCIFPRSKFCSK